MGKVSNAASYLPINPTNESGENQKPKQKEIKLMRDEYEPRDLRYKEFKYLYQEELAGPSLARMEANKRVAIAQHLWKHSEEEEQKSKADKLYDDLIRKNMEVDKATIKSDEKEQYI